MDITMIGLQNAGKTSLLRVLAVSFIFTHLFFPCGAFYFGRDADGVNVQGGEFTLEYGDSFPSHPRENTYTFLSRPSFHRSGVRIFVDPTLRNRSKLTTFYFPS